MKTENWPLLAKLLAIVAHQRLQQVHRAAFCLDGNEDNLIIALFGNDNYSVDARLQSEIDSYREQLAGTGNDELGFALSPDGATLGLADKAQIGAQPNSFRQSVSVGNAEIASRPNRLRAAACFCLVGSI